MPFKIQELQNAYKSYRQFNSGNPHPHHARYIFPFFSGSYFSYRKVDVMRIAAIAKSVSDNPSYLDVGCGYGDFLKRVREFLPNAAGIEKEAGIFHEFKKEKPDYIQLADAQYFAQKFDVAFVGWMEPGVDFRRSIANMARCIITTFDAGGQCGINGGCEYEEFGFDRIAWWRTPSWIDVNTELMNRFYTPSMAEEKKEELSRLRSAHNFWYVYTRPELSAKAILALKLALDQEMTAGKYDFESVLDDCGFGYMEELPALSSNKRLWEVRFD